MVQTSELCQRREWQKEVIKVVKLVYLIEEALTGHGTSKLISISRTGAFDKEKKIKYSNRKTFLFWPIPPSWELPGRTLHCTECMKESITDEV